MTDEIITTTETTDETQKYLDAIADMKRNSVSRAEYDKIRDENKKLLETLVNGESIEGSAEPAPKASLKELRTNVFKKDLSNLEYWQNVLELREHIMTYGDEKGRKEDPFLPHGQKIAPTAEDRQKAQLVADVVGECIEYAEGDAELFTNELQRRTIDVMPNRRR